jgi:hypothetical protein
MRVTKEKTIGRCTGLVWILATALLFSLGYPHSSYAFEIGNLKVGGAIRANYIYGDYEKDGSDGPQRGDNGGNFELDTFRVNLDYKRDNILGKVEYRFYDGYNFLHTGWIGYQFNEQSQVQVGLNRVPFGVGPYGPSNNYFFDMHYYVGLADDMDYGIKYITQFGKLKLDLAYYLMAEVNGRGDTDESARYSYDIVDEGTPYSHYEETHQFNARAIYPVLADILPTDIGVSLQYGLLDADKRFARDTEAYAGAIHSRTQMGNWALMLQLTSYKYDADYRAGTGLSNDLISMGAFDFAWPVASKGTIPSIALSYTWSTPGIDWIDSITFYNDYSIILKDGRAADGTKLNDSAMNVTGMAIASGGWYIYVDYAISDGNLFIGNEGDDYGADRVGDFGTNGNDDWNSRFNINFGYYF